MTREKWDQVIKEAADKCDNASTGITPESWPHNRKCFIDWIKDLDDATEVYNMENKGAPNGNKS